MKFRTGDIVTAWKEKAECVVTRSGFFGTGIVLKHLAYGDIYYIANEEEVEFVWAEIL